MCEDREIVLDYVRSHKRPPLYFIAVLINDLYGAAELQKSGEGLKETVELVHSLVPSEARGSIHAVERWIGEKI